MPDTACLHIQARDSDPIRVVELPGTPVRIGRASYCEVRLDEPDLADEECRLRRRGGAWQLVPSRPAGFVWIDGRSVEEPCPLPFDVPFRVGEHWLTLRPTPAASPEWRTYPAPSPMEVTAGASAVRDASATSRAFGPSAEPPRPSPPPPPSASTSAAEADHLARWRERQEERTSKLRQSPEEKRWEERWRSAGERLRARSADVRPPAPPSAPPAPEPATYTRDRLAGADLRRGATARTGRRVGLTPAPPASPTKPPPARPAVPAGPTPTPGFTEVEVPRVATPPTPSARSATPTEGWGASPLPPVPEARSAPVEVLDAPAPPSPAEEVTPPPEALVEPAPPAVATEPPQEAEPEPTPPTPAAVVAPAEPPIEAPAPVEVEPAPAPAVEPPPAPRPAAPSPTSDSRRAWPGQDPFVTDARPAAAAEVPSPVDLSTTINDAAGLGIRPAATRPGRAAAAPAPSPVAEEPRKVPRPAVAPEAHRAAEETAAAPPPKDDTTPPTSREWPTVRDILAAHRAGTTGQATRRAAATRLGSQPLPTEACEPAHWSLPLWLGWLPAAAMALGAGVLGVALAWTWSADARSTGVVADLLAHGGAEVKPAPETVVPPDGRWWKSTAGSLMNWALYFHRRAGVEPGGGEQAVAMVGAALHASPLNPQARFALARATAETDPASAPGASLGVSRDVEALAWAGQQWMKAGKTEAALRAYREALVMASRADPSRLARPGFDDDPQVRRYRLPGEDLAAAVIRDLAGREGAAFVDWSPALPPFAVAPLAAARLLRERGLPGSDAALDAILARLDAGAPEGCSPAVHLAAQAEALALKSRWAEAAERYRSAIDQMPDDALRRTWWVNLADIAQRLNDEPARQKALEAAKGEVGTDEIAQRAAELLKFAADRGGTIRASR